jgi:hypothetical protein
MNFTQSVRAFLRELTAFDHSLSCTDIIWNMIFPGNENAWYHLTIVKYRDTFYFSHIDGTSCDLEVAPGKNVQAVSRGLSSRTGGTDDPATVWDPIITAARAWLITVTPDWIRAHRRVAGGYPLNRRFGTIPNALIRASLPDLYRLDKELGAPKTMKFVHLVESGFFLNETNTVVESMAAKDYFEYCKIAYVAGKRKDESVDESLSGREMYKRFADGRHEGLLDLDANSKQEFSEWLDGNHAKRTNGGHPWEIKRGGNTSHIDLCVSRPSHLRREGFKVELRGESIGRLAETLKMFLAIHDASFPISIADPEGIRKRLLAQDTIGIIPSYDTLHRANQHFRQDQDVYDVLHYDDLGRFKRRITPFIIWEPLPILKTRKV